MALAGTLVGNAAFILTSDVVNRAATFALYALIARHVGATGVGQLALALTLFYALQVFAAAGLKTAITRQVSTDRNTADRCLATGTVLVTLASAASIGILAGFVGLIGYSGDTASIVMLLGLGLLPYALSSVCEAIFQAIDRMRYIAYAQVPVHAAKVGVAYLLLVRGYSTYHVAIVLLVSHGAIASVELWLMLRHVARPRFESIADTVQSTVTMARTSATFLGIDGLIAIHASVNIVLLSMLATEREVGLYSAASQVLVPVMLVYQSTVLSIFPTLCRKFELGVSNMAHVLKPVLALLLALAMPTAVGLFFLADAVLLLLYGNRDFLMASPALRLMVWNLIPSALTAVLGQVFLASVRERVTLRIVAVDLVVGVVGGAILIAKFGVVGAAIAIVLTKGVDFLQHYIPVSRLVPTLRLHELAWKPVVAVAGMAVYLALADSHQLVLTAATAGTLYIGVLLALALWNAGGPRQLKRRSLEAWSE